MEYSLQRAHVSFWKLWTLINVFEVVALPPVFVASVPLQGLTFAQSPGNLLDGFQCLFLGQGGAAGADDEECATLAYLYPVFVVALIAVKTLQAAVIAKFSSGLVWVVAAAAVPLASQASAPALWSGDGKGHHTTHQAIVSSSIAAIAAGLHRPFGHGLLKRAATAVCLEARHRSASLVLVLHRCQSLCLGSL